MPGPEVSRGMLLRSRMTAAALVLVLGACPNAADKAAKERIFSPEEPPKARRAASEPIDVVQLVGDSALTWRVLTMGADEAFERIGPFRYTAATSFEWSYGTESVALSEKRSLDQASSTEYALHTESRDNGLDLVRLADRTFARSRYHPFRERKRDRGQSALVREDVFGALRSAEVLLGHRMALTGGRRDDVGARAAIRFQAMLARDSLRPSGSNDRKLPPLQEPVGGLDPSTRRRLDFEIFRKPKTVEGSIWVDRDTGVPLKVDLAAKIGAPGAAARDEALLTLKIQSELKPSAQVAVAAPEAFLPDEGRPNGVAAALERFEMQRADGGIAGPSSPAKSPEGEENSDEP